MFSKIKLYLWVLPRRVRKVLFSNPTQSFHGRFGCQQVVSSPKRLPVCTNRDSRFTVRRNGGNWWVHYQASDGTNIPADAPHSELVSLVINLKKLREMPPAEHSVSTNAAR
jgi:hypothetical protein